MKVTKQDIEYKAAPYGHIATIPKGTPVTEATNIPDGGYWAEKWPGMTDTEWSWAESYGFLLTESEVCDA